MFKNVSNTPKCAQMFPKTSKCFQICFKCYLKLPNVPKSSQIPSNAPKCFQNNDFAQTHLLLCPSGSPPHKLRFRTEASVRTTPEDIDSSGSRLQTTTNIYIYICIYINIYIYIYIHSTNISNYDICNLVWHFQERLCEL